MGSKHLRWHGGQVVGMQGLRAIGGRVQLLSHRLLCRPDLVPSPACSRLCDPGQSALRIHQLVEFSLGCCWGV
jgi:hypothetical protein